MKTNLLNIRFVLKGKLLCAILVLFSPALNAQSFSGVSPLETALAGPAVARGPGLWETLSNPASLAGVPARGMRASATPSWLGIRSYAEAGLVTVLAVDSVWGLGASAQATMVPGYREIAGSVVGSVQPERSLSLGAAVTYNALAIDRYGSASVLTLDLGVLAYLSQRVRFGAAMKNPTGSQLAGRVLPRCVCIGFGFDLDDRWCLSVDARHEAGFPASGSMGITYLATAGFELRCGGGTNPGTIAFGAGYDAGDIAFDYGGAYVLPLGFRHVIGAGVRW